MAFYEEHLQTWKALRLDPAIHHQLYRDPFRVFVHHEVLLPLELLQRGLGNLHQFFKSCKFIGTSKPTWRLCNYYSFEHPDNMALKPSHGTLYPEWRLRRVFEDHGLAASAQGRTVLEKVAALASQDALSLLQDKVFRGRLYDKRTHPDIPGVMSGQIESSTSVSSVMPLSGEPRVNGHNSKSSMDASPMQDRGIPDDNGEQSDDGDESDDWVFIG